MTQPKTRRNNPDYMKITGEVQREIGLKFKLYCTGHEISISEAMEKAFELLLNSASPTNN